MTFITNNRAAELWNRPGRCDTWNLSSHPVSRSAAVVLVHDVWIHDHVVQDALEATLPAVDYFEAEVARVERWLLDEQFHDAFTEVMAIKLNVLQAFRQSAAHPEDVHATLNDADDFAEGEGPAMEE